VLWAIVIILLPFLGTILYFALGKTSSRILKAEASLFWSLAGRAIGGPAILFD